jgi:hypothetical protein
MPLRFPIHSSPQRARQATEHPAEALALGILPADMTSLGAAVAAVTGAEAQAHAAGDRAADRQAAARRGDGMHEAMACIVGVGMLAFAQNAVVRAQFEALKPKRA